MNGAGQNSNGRTKIRRRRLIALALLLPLLLAGCWEEDPIAVGAGPFQVLAELAVLAAAAPLAALAAWAWRRGRRAAVPVRADEPEEVAPW